jgi:hypothetical protein
MTSSKRCFHQRAQRRLPRPFPFVTDRLKWDTDALKAACASKKVTVCMAWTSNYPRD